jgi:hypothetical protein
MATATGITSSGCVPRWVDGRHCRGTAGYWMGVGGWRMSCGRQGRGPASLASPGAAPRCTHAYRPLAAGCSGPPARPARSDHLQRRPALPQNSLTPLPPPPTAWRRRLAPHAGWHATALTALEWSTQQAAAWWRGTTTTTGLQAARVAWACGTAPRGSTTCRCAICVCVELGQGLRVRVAGARGSAALLPAGA